MPKGARLSATNAKYLSHAAIAAVDKYFAQTPSLTIAGVAMTPATVKAVFQAELDSAETAAATRALLSGQIAVASKAAKKAFDLRAALRAYVLATYGPKAIAMLGDFKFAVPKPKGPRKVVAKLKAVEAAKATRVARGTMGTKQKRAIKGTPAPSDPKKA